MNELIIPAPAKPCHACGERRFALGPLHLTTYGDLPETNRAYSVTVRWDCANESCDEWYVCSTSKHKEET